MPQTIIREHTEHRIQYYLRRTKDPIKVERWKALLREARETKRPATSLTQQTLQGETPTKHIRGEIMDYFTPKTITEKTLQYTQLKMNPQKVITNILQKALKKGAPISRIKKQENKYKHLLEYETTLWGEDQGQTTKIAQWTETGKTLQEIIQKYTELGIQEGNKLDTTKYHQEILPKLNAQGTWLGKKQNYTINAINIKTRLVKG